MLELFTASSGMFRSPEAFLINLVLILPIFYFILFLMGKWNYWTLTASYLSALIIGIFSSLLPLGFVIFPPVSLFIFYVTFKKTLTLNVEGTSPPEWLWVPIAFGVVLPFYAVLEGLIILIGMFIVTFLFQIGRGPGRNLLLGYLILAAPFPPMYFIYKSWIKGPFNSQFEKTQFNSKKYILLSFGLLCSFLTFLIRFYLFFIEV